MKLKNYVFESGDKEYVTLNLDTGKIVFPSFEFQHAITMQYYIQLYAAMWYYTVLCV